MNKDTKISQVLSKYGAFWAFGEAQFNEQKQEGIKYISLGAGLICPKDNFQDFKNELDKTLAEIKKEEKEQREARAKALKIEKLPKNERIENRKILIKEATSRINNFADSCWIAEHYKMINNSNQDNINEVIISLLSAIASEYHKRADYESEVKEIYDENIATIKELQAEILEIIKE